MADHARTQLRDYFRELLKGIPVAATPDPTTTFTRLVGRTETPSISIEMTSDVIDEETTVLGCQGRLLLIQIVVRLKKNDTVAKDLDDIAVLIERKMAAPYRDNLPEKHIVAGVEIPVYWQNDELDYSGRLEKDTGRLRMEYAVNYHVDNGVPDKLV